MIYIILGVFAFLLFIIYDINSVLMKIKLLQACFFIGFLLLMVATIGIVIEAWDIILFHTLRMVGFGTFAGVFLYLLIYTLFFALPFKDTYIENEGLPKVCNNGVYALCRHPGVLWFTGFYLFIALALNIPLLLTAAIIFSSLNILYVIFQDQWTFMKVFDDYEQYQIETPFLIPNRKSIKRCFETLSQEEEKVT
jgi:protein-S-isoprenylcysteine O-methyltransferase Ste14